MSEKAKLCGNNLCLDLSNYIDNYDYHDAQSYFDFHCDLEKDHEGMHSVIVEHQKIYWKD